MAKISTVDYKDMASKAKTIRNDAQALNKEFTNAYLSIQDMHQNWYGIRYNSLVSEFNELVPSVNEILELTVTDIPFTLETVANNYSLADNGNKATSAQQTAPNKVSSLPTPSDVGMRFLTSNVQQTQKTVSTNFKNAKDKMTSIQNVYKSIAWTSEAATAFAQKFASLKSSIDNAIDTINTDFVKLMTQAQNDIQSAESANTVQ